MLIISFPLPIQFHSGTNIMATTCVDPQLAPVLPDLATIRQSKGITLRQIAEATKISPLYLQAIEESHFDRLPGGVFSTSYIRQYARAIDYDEWDLLAYFDSVVNAEPAPENILEPTKRGTLRISEFLAPFQRWINGSSGD